MLSELNADGDRLLSSSADFKDAGELINDSDPESAAAGCDELKADGATIEKKPGPYPVTEMRCKEVSS